VGTFAGTLIAYRRRRADPRSDTFPIITRWSVVGLFGGVVYLLLSAYPDRMPVRYAIAASVMVASAVAFVFVAEDWSSLLQFLWMAVAIVVVGAIAFPDDLKRNPPPRRDVPPGA